MCGCRLVRTSDLRLCPYLFLFWYPHHFLLRHSFTCFLQNACPCLADEGGDMTLLVADNFLKTTTGATSPEVCTNAPAVMPSNVGTCEWGSSYAMFDDYTSALACWDACWEIHGDETWCVAVLYVSIV